MSWDQNEWNLGLLEKKRNLRLRINYWPLGFWKEILKNVILSKPTIKGKTPFWVRSSAKQGKDSKIEEDPRYIVLVIIKW